jgi:hypothetical protein
MREIDIWLEDTFGRAPNKLTCLKEELSYVFPKLDDLQAFRDRLTEAVG